MMRLELAAGMSETVYLVLEKPHPYYWAFTSTTFFDQQWKHWDPDWGLEGTWGTVQAPSVKRPDYGPWEECVPFPKWVIVLDPPDAWDLPMPTKMVLPPHMY